MEAVGGAVLSAVLEPLIQKLKSSDLLKFAHRKQLDDELKKWESRLLDINAVLRDGEEMQITNAAVKIWHSKLKDLVYDVEDILDEFVTEALQKKLREESQASTTMKKLIPTWCDGMKLNSIRQNVKMGSVLAEITARLEEIVRERDHLHLRIVDEMPSNKASVRVSTTPSIKETKVYGREMDKKAVLELLQTYESIGSQFSVISITGIGGIGKTTLAQLVYNDKSVEFDCRAWACVSEEFDILKITKTILLHWENCENDLRLLQDKLEEKLSGKKFLIVLDDVWNENYEKWTTLRTPFLKGAPGSKVIVTTRNKGVSSLIGSAHTYQLEELSQDDCLSLFVRHALDAENFDAHRDLEGVGRSIVSKCKGLPLAAKTLGGLLRDNKNARQWEVLLNSRIWELPETKTDILPALRLSFHYLPSYLKQCFAYCAIFPKDYEFDEDELIYLWMGEGFLQLAKDHEPVELGHAYFYELALRSFFQQSSRDKARYVMHDLIHDLAQYVSGEKCWNLDDDLKNVRSFTKARHLSFTPREYDTSERFLVVNEMNKLRTFLVLPQFFFWENYLSTKVLHDLLPKLKRLRVLSLASYTIEELPSSVGALTHLRYLNLSDTRIIRLPETLSKLINLQTLILRGCDLLAVLPRGFHHLINLLHLDITDTPTLEVMPAQIGNLKNLRVLTKFIVGREQGCAISELRSFSHLTGDLHVTGLHNVVNIRDSEHANMKEKHGLDKLTLEWTDDFNGLRNQRQEQHVLDSMRPHRNLKMLSIISYGGLGFPRWVGDPSFANIVQLRLSKCLKSTSLPPLGKLPLLKDLCIKRMEEVKGVGLEFCGNDSHSLVEAFPSLEYLRIEDILKWESWSWSDGLNQVDQSCFAKLREFEIRNCPKLAGKFPDHLPSLTKLGIYSCPKLASLPKMLPSLLELRVEECQDVVLQNGSNLPSLTFLMIRRIAGLTCLRESFTQSLVALEDLVIRNCSDLMHLWRDETCEGKLASLKRVEIDACKQLVSLVEGGRNLPRNIENLTLQRCSRIMSLPGKALLSNLKRLDILGCQSLESMPDGIITMDTTNDSRLEELSICECESLKPFPKGKLPATLKSLKIISCKNLESLSEEILYNPAHSHESQKCQLKELVLQDLDRMPFPPPQAAMFPASLDRILIVNCKIQSLEFQNGLSRLKCLTISYCPELKSFPDGGLATPVLTDLCINHCRNLNSLPNLMDCLASLRLLKIVNCASLVCFPVGGLPPGLTSLVIRNCKKLAQPMEEWGLHRLASLEYLHIDSCKLCTYNIVSFPDKEGLLLPTSLTGLDVGRFEDMKSLSKSLQNLTSLQVLRIWDCHKLQHIPKEGFPRSLGLLDIHSCPKLSKRCSTKKGDYWAIIANIPRVVMDHKDRIGHCTR